MDKIKKFHNINRSGISYNMLISGICKPLSMVLSYLYVPIVLSYLGVEKYGVWSTILMILSWISYFDIGIGNGLRNKLTESINKKDGKEKKLISSAYVFITVIMIGIAMIFAAAASFVDWNKIFGISEPEENLTAIIIVSVIFVAVNFILSICKNILYALQKAGSVSFMELMVQVINFVSLLIIKQKTNGNLFTMAVIYGTSMIIVNLAASFFIYGKKKEIRLEITQANMEVGIGLTKLGIQFFVIQVCTLILFTTDNLIISYLYGAVKVTPYSTVIKMFQAITGLYAALLTPVWSAVTKIKTEHQYNRLEEMIKKLRLIMLPFAVGVILLMIVFRPVMKIWLRQELDFDSSLVVFGGIYCLLNNWCNTYASVANGLELMTVSIWVAGIQAIINIPLSLIFAEKFGMKSTGVLAGTVVSMMIAAVIQPIAVKKEIKKSMRNKLHAGEMR